MSRKSPNYPTGNSSFAYSLVYPWVAKGEEYFFDGFYIKGTENFPNDGPIMLVGNHQNAMLDPLVFCKVIPRQLHWLARSDVFKNPMVAKILYRLNMLPIYREKDKVADQMERNESVFSVCRTRLSKGAVIAMFPEGSHRGKKQLMTPLKKGFARLAFSSIERDPSLMELKIVPIGLDYSDFYSYHPRVILEMGKPIAVKDFWSDYLVDQNRAINALLKSTQETLSGLMVDIRDDDAYDHLIRMAPVIEAAHVGDTVSQWQHYRQFCNRYTEISSEEKAVLHSLDQSLSAAGLTAEEMELSRNDSNWKLNLLWTIEALPGFLGKLFYYPHYAITEKFIKKNIQDELFFNSIRLASYTFLSPIYIGLMWLIISNLIPMKIMWYTHVWGILLLMSLGMFAISLDRMDKKREKVKRWKRWAKQNADKEKEILSLRKLWREIHEN